MAADDQAVRVGQRGDGFDDEIDAFPRIEVAGIADGEVCRARGRGPGQGAKVRGLPMPRHTALGPDDAEGVVPDAVGDDRDPRARAEAARELGLEAGGDGY